ncbi:MAG: DUF4190 domain-containing protein, partial [Pseudobutyrivibrio sp.]|nr:DUF4190 domain-containing protein [Pseudobutyrivibrio sp.]
LENKNGRPNNYGLAIASLIMGIVSLVFFLFILNIFTAVAAIIMGLLFLGGTARGCKGRGMALAGVITSILSIVLCIGSYVLIFQNADNISNMMEDELRKSPEFNYEFNYGDDSLEDDYFNDLFDNYYNDNGIDSLDDTDDTL